MTQTQIDEYEIISYGDEIFKIPIKIPYEQYEREYLRKEKLKERKEKLQQINGCKYIIKLKKAKRKEKLMIINKKINEEGWSTEEEFKEKLDLTQTGLYLITSSADIQSKSEIKPTFEVIDTVPDYGVKFDHEKRN